MMMTLPSFEGLVFECEKQDGKQREKERIRQIKKKHGHALNIGQSEKQRTTTKRVLRRHDASLGWEGRVSQTICLNK